MMQLNNIERYLKAFNIKVDQFTTVQDLQKYNLDHDNIIFIDYLSMSNDEMKEFLNNLPEIPVIMIASRLERDFITSLSDKIAKVIFKPVYASKIIGAIIELLYNDKK